jgi:hypothetical protein
MKVMSALSHVESEKVSFDVSDLFVTLRELTGRATHKLAVIVNVAVLLLTGHHLSKTKNSNISPLN